MKEKDPNYAGYVPHLWLYYILYTPTAAFACNGRYSLQLPFFFFIFLLQDAKEETLLMGSSRIT